MAHETNIPYLNHDNINEYFKELAEAIESAGIGEHRILVVGGAAIALKYRNQRATVDIDMCFKEQNKLYQCCQEVAVKHRLPADWVNADVMHSDSFSYALFDNATLYKQYSENLFVYIASELDLYCMKLVSFRSKDIQDMAVLQNTLNAQGTQVKDVKENFVRLYGSEYLLQNDPRKMKLVEAQLK